MDSDGKLVAARLKEAFTNRPGPVAVKVADLEMFVDTCVTNDGEYGSTLVWSSSQYGRSLTVKSLKELKKQRKTSATIADVPTDIRTRTSYSRRRGNNHYAMKFDRAFLYNNKIIYNSNYISQL